MFGARPKIRIDRSLFDRLTALARRAGYASTEEMILHVLEREAGRLEQAADDADLAQRLRGLGYIE